MAVSAKFIADFSSFESAVQKAEVSLRGFEGDANKVTKSLTAMSNSLNGTKTIQDATLMARAVEKIGGVAKLTEAELSRLSAQAREAAEKMRLMGVGVPDNLQKIANAAKPASDGINSLVGGVSKLAAIAGIGLSVGAVVNFGKAILEDADALVKLSDKTGVSIAGLQRLQAAGDDAGNSIEEMTGAVSQLENRLASGDKSALSALTKLGISLEDFERLNPENQFIAISDAIRGIQDPAQQTAIAMDLFGRQGAAVLPTLKRGFDDLKGASVGMSEATVRALDEAGDTLTRWGRNAKAAGAVALIAAKDYIEGGLNPMNHALKNIERQAQADEDALKRMAAAIPAPKTVGFNQAAPLNVLSDGSHAEATIRESNKLLSDLESGAKKATLAIKKLNDEALAKMRDRLKEIDPGTVTFKLVALTDAVKDLTSEAPFSPLLRSVSQLKAEAIPTFEQLRITLGKFGDKIKEIERQGLPYFIDGLEKLGQKAEVVAQQVTTLGTRLKDTFMRSLEDLNGIFQRAFEGGGDWKGAIKSWATEVIEGLLEMIPVVGPFIKKFAGAIVEGFKRALRISTPEMEINPIRQAFVDAAGGLEELNGRAHEAGVTLDRLLNAKNPEAYKKAIDELNAAFQFQDDAMRTLDETVQKYGLTFEELGPALQRQSLDKKAQELYQDFKVLTGAGVDTTIVLGKMGDSINQFVHDALKTGTEIPAAMKPMLQHMAEMGTLTDESGNVITDLGQSGIKFSETMTEGFNKVVKSVDKLVIAIERGLGLAIETVSNHLEDLPDEVDIDIKYRTPRDPILGYGESPEPVYPMASGGVGRVTKPTLFLAGESGPEDYSFRPVGSRSSGSAPISVSVGQVTIQAGDSDDPKSIADKFIEALRTQSALYQGIAVIADRRISAAT